MILSEDHCSKSL